MTSNRSDECREIWVNVFDEKHAQRFREQVLRVADHGEEVLIPVFIDSYGGYVDSLAKMIETMDGVPNRFITICMGKAMSCGAILLSHGDIRWSGQYSRVMVHNIHAGSWGDAYDLEASSRELTRMNYVFMELLAQNCGKSYDELQRAIRESTCGKEIWLDPNDAFEFGLVDYVGTPTVQPIVQYMMGSQPEKERLTDKEKGVKRSKRKTNTKKKTSSSQRRRT